MDKSYVTMEQHQCLVCGKLFDTGAILLDQRLRDKFDKHTVTGVSLCPEHAKMHKDGYLALVEVAEKQEVKDRMKLEDAVRTGRIVHIRRYVAKQLFNVPLVDSKGEYFPMMFVDKEVVDHLEAMQKRCEE